MGTVGTEAQTKTVLITLMGRDRPGVTAAMFSTLSDAGVEVLDIEQIVLAAGSCSASW